MTNLEVIRSFTIFGNAYGMGMWACEAEHDVLYGPTVGFPCPIPKEEQEELEEIGWFVESDNWRIFV